MKRSITLHILILISANLLAQNTVFERLSVLFGNQLKVFPHEKIYLHIDKPYYISGEQIWFRAYMVDAAKHTPVYTSRYIYVELINPLDSVVNRVKIHQTDSVYSGHIDLAPDLPEGDYTLRAYTYFMQNLDECYWFTRNIRIGDPQARMIDTDTQFHFESEEKITAEFRFKHPTSLDAVIPAKIKASINGGKLINIKTQDNYASMSFNLSSHAEKRVMLMEIEDDKYMYRQFISIPFPDDDFDITFYPEGGNLLEGALTRVAFKALKSNGKSAEITGLIYDNHDNAITPIKSSYLGMGFFSIYPEKGKTYYAICTNEDGQSKRFGLPAAHIDQYALSVNQRNDNLFVSVLKPGAMTQQDTLYLLAHARGIVYHADMWARGKTTVAIPNNMFPSGVLHLLLLDASLRPLSERLVFINNNDDITNIDFRTDKDNYDSRSPVHAEIMLTNRHNEPLAGNFSVSVTDDRAVITDTCNSILTSLLLTSELKGYIERPASYFEKDASSSKKIDLLMLTQGWRRYDIASLVGGTLSYPLFPLEIGAEISGTVKSLLTGKPSINTDVTIFASNNNFIDKVKTDQYGKYRFLHCDFPDSTQFIIHAHSKSGFRQTQLDIDEEHYPPVTLSAMAQESIDKDIFTQYVSNAEQKYTNEHGLRTVHLEEVTVTARKIQRPEYQSVYYNEPDHSISEDYLDKVKPSTLNDIYSILKQVPGLRVVDGQIVIRGGNSFTLDNSPLLLIDDFPASMQDIVPQDIAKIDILKNASIFGMRGSNGAIIIYTKEAKDRPSKDQFNVKFITPLGYQKQMEFYAPKYDVQVNNDMPDLRTTIHWQPVVQVDNTGKASFSFYTADSKTTYTVVIEGLSNDGKMIRKQEKILVNVK